ncbi:hypothetical protein NQ317_016755 [Molorchus minor]|uniref:Lipase domain-containing protein n=1 Tax=Molorchus minor TaxID=1323400 RepID=A0ABQ9JMH7_9CUCU|nr:hypothetical protein NQ317_016755 [Molorchus minor]
MKLVIVLVAAFAVSQCHATLSRLKTYRNKILFKKRIKADVLENLSDVYGMVNSLIRNASQESVNHLDKLVVKKASDKYLFTMDVGPNMTHFLVEQGDGTYVTENLINVEFDAAYSPSDLTYYYYSPKNETNVVQVKSHNLNPLKNSDFDASRETFFIIHGWHGSYSSEVNTLIKKAVLSQYDVNVIVVDWSAIASKNYLSARWAVSDVGKYVADFITALVESFGVEVTKVAITGHSLGSHIAGNAGAALQGQVDRIIGLDPSLPLFSLNTIDDRLDPSDAQMVQVIHTCSGWLGFQAPIGHTDYYPNGGTFQPGCGWDVAGFCAHSRSYIYFAESVAPPEGALFVARECSTYNAYENGKCNKNLRSVMGGYQLDKGARGLQFLNTNKEPPFAQG